MRPGNGRENRTCQEKPISYEHAIYEHIPMSVDERADQAATKFSQLLKQETDAGVTL
jgi:hypothetical protein